MVSAPVAKYTNLHRLFPAMIGATRGGLTRKSTWEGNTYLKKGKAGLLAQPATIYRNEALHCNRALVRHPYGGAWRRADPGPRWDSVCRDDAAHQAARVPEDPPSHRLVVKPEGGPRTWRAGQWEEVPPPPALSREGARSFGCAWENLHSWRLQRPWSRNSQQMPGGRPR